MREGTLSDYEFDGSGRIVAFTTVHRGISGFDSPYALAVVSLDAGPSFIGQLHDWQGQDLEIGQRVELVIAPIKRDAAGNEIIGPKFHPIRQ
jgi:uncharacterized OB-fold protein